MDLSDDADVSSLCRSYGTGHGRSSPKARRKRKTLREKARHARKNVSSCPHKGVKKSHSFKLRFDLECLNNHVGEEIDPTSEKNITKVWTPQKGADFPDEDGRYLEWTVSARACLRP